MGRSGEGKQYMELAEQVDNVIQYLVACGMQYNTPVLSEILCQPRGPTDVDYEQGLTRKDITTAFWCAPCPHALAVLCCAPVQTLWQDCMQ